MVAKNISRKEVDDQVKRWHHVTERSQARAESSINFCNFYEQWTDIQKSVRENHQKLVIPFVKRYLSEVTALVETIELSLMLLM